MAYVQIGNGIMVINPFSVCSYAANYYKNERRLVLVVFHFYNGLRHKHKQEMELFYMRATSCYICQLLTDLQRVRMSLPFGGHLISDKPEAVLPA